MHALLPGGDTSTLYDIGICFRLASSQALLIWRVLTMDMTKNSLCPFLASPLPKCYCLRSESIWAVRMVEFCAGRFELCEYYRKHFMDTGEPAEDPKE
jgi:hypothetical protein